MDIEVFVRCAGAQAILCCANLIDATGSLGGVVGVVQASFVVTCQDHRRLD